MFHKYEIKIGFNVWWTIFSIIIFKMLNSLECTMHVNVWNRFTHACIEPHTDDARKMNFGSVFKKKDQNETKKNTKKIKKNDKYVFNILKEVYPTKKKKISRHRHHYSFHPICCAFNWTCMHARIRPIGHFVWVKQLLKHEAKIRTTTATH